MTRFTGTADLHEHERGDAGAAARQAAWEETAAALLDVLALADAFGVTLAGRDALDAQLIHVAHLTAQGQRVSFEAGLRAGAGHGGGPAPSAN